MNDGNPKAASFVGTAMSKWITSSLTTLRETFRGASSMNSDLSAWKVGKVASLEHTFSGANRFAGTGLDLWITTSVTTLYNTFIWAYDMNADLSGWSVAKVTTLGATFRSASKFVGTGLSLWNTAAVTSLHTAFKDATAMNADLGGWDTSAFVRMTETFNRARSFAGIGLWRWDVAKTTTIDADTLAGTTKLDDCTKKRIASAWKSNDAFSATMTTACGFNGDCSVCCRPIELHLLWTALVCPRPDDSRLTDAQIILVRQSTEW